MIQAIGYVLCFSVPWLLHVAGIHGGLAVDMLGVAVAALVWNSHWMNKRLIALEDEADPAPIERVARTEHH